MELLLDALEDLTGKELKKFKLFLMEDTLDGFKRISKGDLETTDPSDVTKKMIEAYPNGSLTITVHILKKMGRNDLVQRIESKMNQPRAAAAADSGHVSAPLKDHNLGQVFFSKHRGALETRLPDVLSSILIPLVENKVLSKQEREMVESKPTPTERNHALLTIIEKKGRRAQQVFYEALEKVDNGLVTDLEKTS